MGGAGKLGSPQATALLKVVRGQCSYSGGDVYEPTIFGGACITISESPFEYFFDNCLV